jgi:glyoxylate/hydroxypyruvate reductase A
MTLLYNADPVRGEHWKTLFADRAPDIEWRAWPELGDPQDIRYLAAWQAPDDLETLLPNLQVLFALSAGVDQLDLSRLPASLPVVRLLDPGITQGMCEYASFAVLSVHRDMLRYRQQQAEKNRQVHRLLPASKRRVGVMGLGLQARQILATLQPYGFSLSGWARSRHSSVNATSCSAPCRSRSRLRGFLTVIYSSACPKVPRWSMWVEVGT